MRIWARPAVAVLACTVLASCFGCGGRGQAQAVESAIGFSPIASLAIGAAGTAVYIAGSPPDNIGVWQLARLGTSGESRTLYHGSGRLEAFSLSPDGAEALVMSRPAGAELLETRVTRLRIGRHKATLVAEIPGEAFWEQPWSGDGRQWAGVRDGTALVLHRGDSDEVALRAPAGLEASRPGVEWIDRTANKLSAAPHVADIWAAPELGSAFLLLTDGRLFRCSAKAVKEVAQLPSEPVRVWGSSHATNALFVLSGDELIRVTLTNGRVEARSLAGRLRAGEQGLELRAMDDEGVAIVAAPDPKVRNRAGGTGAPPAARISLLRYPNLRAEEVLVLPLGAELCTSRGGSAFACTAKRVYAVRHDPGLGQATLIQRAFAH
jgi:hypothetical protein